MPEFHSIPDRIEELLWLWLSMVVFFMLVLLLLRRDRFRQLSHVDPRQYGLILHAFAFPLAVSLMLSGIGLFASPWFSSDFLGGFFVVFGFRLFFTLAVSFQSLLTADQSKPQSKDFR